MLSRTHLGHSALYCLCQFIQIGEGQGNVALVRGAVCLVGRSLWGNQRIEQLDSYSPMTILPTFAQALQCNNPLVIFEVTFQVDSLVKNCCYDLRATGSDAVLSLVEMLLTTIPKKVSKDVMQSNMLRCVHNIISTFEKLVSEKKYVGSKHRLYSVIDQCSCDRQEQSVINLLTYRSNEIYPTKQGWIAMLNEMMEKYYRLEKRSSIRLKSLAIMMEVLRSNRQIYEEEILVRVVLPLLDTINQEDYDDVTIQTINALATICMESSTKHCLDILEAFTKVIERPLFLKSKDPLIRWTEKSHDDISSVIKGLIDIICAKVCHSSAFIVEKAYSILVKHLEDNYDNPDVFGHTGEIRANIFRLFMRMRANESSHLGIEDESNKDQPQVEHKTKDIVHFSPFLICQQPRVSRERNPSGHSESNSAPIMETNVTYISLTKACLLVIKSLSYERDWQVLKLILSEVPSVLQNKAILSRYGTALYAFVNPLIDLTKNNSPYPDCLTNIQTSRLLKSEFQQHVYPVLAAMAPYNEYLESTTTRALINALQNGLLSRDCNRFCIVALTACALEMRKSMYAKIPEVLLNFSKISPTTQIATPMLEFLSTLIRLPDIFTSFTDTNYMSVFAIALPFTNPFKFDEYTVSLAHHVIVMWFLKCRLAYRQNFVTFIISGLNSNVLSNFEDGGFRKGAVTVTGKSSQAKLAAQRAADKLKRTVMVDQKPLVGGRPRAASFTDTPVKSMVANPSRDRHPTAGISRTANTQDANMEKMMTFHQELSETCVDILARYMFANASVKPNRLATTEFLLKGGQSASWMVGTMIITVTTSICDQTSSRGELCDRCYLICKTNPKPGDHRNDRSQSGFTLRNSQTECDGDLQSDILAQNEQDSTSRKRHASAFVGTSPVKSDGKTSSDLWNLRKSSNAGLGSIMGRRVSVSDEILMPLDTVGKKDRVHGLAELNSNENCELESLINRQREDAKKKPELCACWCSGWAEIHVRRPSGDVSWMCRIQNPSLSSESHADIPLTDLTALFHPSMEDQETEFGDNSLKTTSSEKINQTEQEQWRSCDKDVEEKPMTCKDLDFSGGIVELTESIEGANECKETIKSSILPESSSNIPLSPSQKTSPNPKLLQTDNSSELDLPKSTLTDSRPQCDPILEEEDRSFAQRRFSIAHHAKLDGTKSESSGNSRRRSEFPKDIEMTKAKPLMKEPISFRDRAHTISGPSPRKMPLARQTGTVLTQAQIKSSSPGSLISDHKAERVTGISPQFVFLSLYHTYGFGRMQNPVGMLDQDDINEKPSTSNDTPLLIPNSDGIKMAIKSLDRIHAHETHKVGVMYIGPGQADNEQLILSNEFGSLRYADFLHGLGTLIPLRDIDKSCTFLGGLSPEDGDGEFSYMWEDDVMQVIFHVATMMPNRENDPKCSKKKRHIGNDFVAIVYNNSGDGSNYKLGTVKGQFIYACVVITPLDEGSNRVEIVCRPELDEPLGHVKEAKTVSDRNLAILVRQQALHCSLAAQIQQTLGSKRDPYASNWLERLRQLKRIKERVLKDSENSASIGKEAGGNKSASNDFTIAVLRRTEKSDVP